MRAIDFPFQVIEGLKFTPGPQPLSASIRPIYRIALIVLVLKTNCRGNTASLFKLQFFNWVLKSMHLQKVVEDRLAPQSVFILDLIHLDPMVNLALKYAFADNIVSITSTSKYQLTEKGHKLADSILQAEHPIMIEERNLLERIGRGVTEVKLKDKLI